MIRIISKVTKCKVWIEYL